ncbi:unnamed protein product [Oncorhynchus mykiss]|uniref:Arf-GAP with coiled-coil, ANK repeat and PH domain-containing protein n=1 Tax=Oncorhynchus mykiss TaxID=8022 RepID=A0A060XZ63_ONCMY|nr:unnamed protein product [Oncorhynchus mykiss]
MPATLPPPSPCKELVVFSEPKEYSSGLQLYWASCARSLPDMAEALAHGAEVNWVNTDDDKRTPLIMAVQGGSLVTCEFLLQNAGNVNQQDALGRGPLHHATILGHTGQVCLFLKRGANQNAADIEAKTPLSMAVDAANADIVTLLRLAKMNEEMREAEGPYMQSGDETYQDIFQDFSQMASNDPEKLNRYQQQLQDNIVSLYHSDMHIIDIIKDYITFTANHGLNFLLNVGLFCCIDFIKAIFRSDCLFYYIN